MDVLCSVRDILKGTVWSYEDVTNEKRVRYFFSDSFLDREPDIMPHTDAAKAVYREIMVSKSHEGRVGDRRATIDMVDVDETAVISLLTVFSLFHDELQAGMLDTDEYCIRQPAPTDPVPDSGCLTGACATYPDGHRVITLYTDPAGGLVRDDKGQLANYAATLFHEFGHASCTLAAKHLFFSLPLALSACAKRPDRLSKWVASLIREKAGRSASITKAGSDEYWDRFRREVAAECWKWKKIAARSGSVNAAEDKEVKDVLNAWDVLRSAEDVQGVTLERVLDDIEKQHKDNLDSCRRGVVPVGFFPRRKVGRDDVGITFYD